MLHLRIHPEDPQARLISQAVERIRAGDVVVYPTDAAYAIGCQIGNKKAMERISQIRGLGPKHQYAIICADLSDISTYAKVDNAMYRLLKNNIACTNALNSLANESCLRIFRMDS